LVFDILGTFVCSFTLLKSLNIWKFYYGTSLGIGFTMALVRFVIQPYSCDIYVRQWAWVEAITTKYLHKLLCNHHFNWIASFVCFTSLLSRILWYRIGRNNCTNNDLSTLPNEPHWPWSVQSKTSFSPF